MDALSARNWAMLTHLSALILFLGVPFGNIIGPLIVWLLKRHDHPFVDAQGREALNFQISIMIYAFVAGFLFLFGIGALLLLVLAVAKVILVVVASVRVSEGTPYRYPFTIRLL